MINALAIMEGIYSTEIENGPYTPQERMAVLIFLLSRSAGDEKITMKVAMEVAEGVNNEAPLST